MPFRPSTKSQVTIVNTEYRFAEHPAAKGMPYGQTGRRATVYQVQDAQGQFHALKVFTNAFRTVQTESGAQRIQAFANLPGLQVCSRLVLTKQNSTALLGQYPELEFAVLMPWAVGQTWQEIVLARQPLTQAQSLSLASNFVSVLAEMEKNGLAHCDLSGPNVLVTVAPPFLVDRWIGGEGISLVDVEDLYAPALEKPEKLPGGSAGYGHKTAAAGLWSPEADRFAGAVLLAEMLGWCDEGIRRIAVGEQYFDSKEMQQPSDRFNLLRDTLEKRFGHGCAEAFTVAWFSPTLSACPPFSAWLALLQGDTSPGPQTIPQKPVELNDAGRYLFDSLKTKIAENNLVEAEKLVNALRALAPDFDEAAQLLDQARQSAAQDQARRDALARLEKELAEKQQILQSLNAEKDALLAEIAKAEQARLIIEEQIEKIKISTVPVKLNTPKKTLTKSRISQSSPVLPPPEPAIAELNILTIYDHTRFLQHQPVEDGLFLPDGKGFVTIAQDKKVRFWLFEKEKTHLAEEISCRSIPKELAANSQANLLAMGDENGWVNIWSVKNKTHKLIGSFDMPNEITSLAFSPSGDTLAVGSIDGNIHLISTEKLAFVWRIDTPPVDALVFSPDNKYLALGSSEGGIQLLTIPNYVVVAGIRVGENPSLVFDSKSKFLYCTDSGGMVTILDVPNLHTALSFSLSQDHRITSLAISSNDELLAVGIENGDIYLVRASDGKSMCTSTGHHSSVFALDFHPSGRYLLSGSYDGRAIIWNIE